jgi:hypothetical protein
MEKRTGAECHDITLAQASGWTKNYRDTISVTETIAHYFGKQAIQAILNQEDCVGLRLYYALDNDSNKQIIVVGVDEDNNDLYNGLLAERSLKCPQDCPTANPLNSDV